VRRVGTALSTVLALAACSGAAADHEKLGDRLYADRHFADALVEYRLALKLRAPTAQLLAKAGAAALHAGELAVAAEEYQALAKGSSRVTEAADGLERVARAAVANDDRSGLFAALAGLREVAAGRALGSFALQLAQAVGGESRSGEALNLLPYAAAGAPDAGRQDSLMFAYGSALQRAGHCNQAIPVFEGVARRQREPAVVQPAAQAMGHCGLALGRQALEAGQPDQAEELFRRVAAGGGERDPSVRAAYIGIGDVLFARHAFAEAAEAYQRAMAGAEPGDSLAQIAGEKLNLLANAGTVIR
jgi:tetratricopeptide (TPR) repeat protein